MNVYLLPIILQTLALAVGVAEVLIPSLGLLMILSLGMMGYSWYHIVVHLPSAIWIFALADIILIPFAIKISLSLMSSSPFSHRISVGTGSGLEAEEDRIKMYLGQTAVVESQLRPTGKILVNGEIHEASSSGDMINRGEVVRIVAAVGNKFVVEKVN